MKPMLRYLMLMTSILLSTVLFAADFKISQIEIHGLERLQSPAIISHLPIKVGQNFTNQASKKLLQHLYLTNYFSNVSLKRQGNRLIIDVKERPTIGLIQVRGNKAIKSKPLNESLKASKLLAGNVFDPSLFNAYVQGLRHQYQLMGHYRAQVKTTVKPESRNRVAINIQIDEGPVAKIRGITFLGNKKFSGKKLRGVLHSKKTGVFSFLTRNNYYSEDKINQDISNLANFYFDHGYLQFQIVSKQVTMSADHRDIRIVVRVNEGPQFKISSMALKGQMLGQRSKIEPFLKEVKVGDLFSRKAVLAVAANISHVFADQGYASASVKPIPTLNVPKRTVALDFVVDPKSLVYVRHIDFMGNLETNEAVLRSQILQMENGLYSRKKLQESNRRLANVPYIQFINRTVKPVKNHEDQVDVLYHVKEVQSGRAQINGGYSDTEGFLYGASISEPNFMGQGHSVGFSFTRSRLSESYSTSYFNPFYRPNGLGRGFSAFYSHVTPGNVNITNYALNQYGVNTTFSFPFTLRSRINSSFGYKHYEVIVQDYTPDLVKNFIDEFGQRFDQGVATVGWNYGSLDRFLFPTSGFTHSASTELDFPLNHQSLTFYRLNYGTQWFLPLNHSHSLVLNFHSNLGYGGGLGNTPTLPFFQHYFAGGIDSVPGFEGNSLGPLDKYGNALGGRILTTAGFNFYFPNFITDNLRTGLTFDAGNVFLNNFELSGQNGLRYSAGLVFRMKLPIFPSPISISFARALKERPTDRTQLFGFNMGGAF